jgi:hypothetical protein
LGFISRARASETSSSAPTFLFSLASTSVILELRGYQLPCVRVP